MNDSQDKISLKEKQLKNWEVFNELHMILKHFGLSFDRQGINQLKTKEKGRYLKLIKKGLKAKDYLYSSLEGIVVKYANSYQNANTSFNVLYQQGQLGIHEGLIKFNPNLDKMEQLKILGNEKIKKGQQIAFSSYATFWIRAKVYEALKASNLIKTPAKEEAYNIFTPEDMSKVDEFVYQDNSSLLEDIAPNLSSKEQEILEAIDNPLAIALENNCSINEAIAQKDKLINKIKNIKDLNITQSKIA